jgi:polyhydroxyalkanoate synthase
MQSKIDCRMVNGVAATWHLYEQIDKARRLQGAMMDALGLGPQETTSRVVLGSAGLTLKAYGDAAGGGPIILLVPAPIKRAYIWDLAPGASVVEQCLVAGARAYLVQWEEPEAACGLDDFADRLLLACVDAIRAETGAERLFLIGHSLGGLLAAIFAALHPERVQGLAVLTAPLHFDFDRSAGVLGPVIDDLSRSGLLEMAPSRLPGSFLSLASFMASPSTFGRDRLMDWLQSWPDQEAMRLHLRIERWSLDELPLARQFVVDIEKRLYGEDAFLRGTLRCGGRTASARGVVAPLLVVADRRCVVVPPQAILPFEREVSSRDKRLLWYAGDVGVAIQHVGVLVGHNALRHIWPEILRWLHVHGKPSASTH